MDTEVYRKRIEKEISEIIEEKLKNRQMNASRAREIAIFVLNALHPHMTLEQIHSVVQDFDDHFSELIPIVLQVSNDYEEQVIKVVEVHVNNLLKQNKVTEASDMIKRALEKKIKLSE